MNCYHRSRFRGISVIVCPKSLEMKVDHLVPGPKVAKDLYSASTFDLETVNCFFDDQVNKFPPMYRHNLVVDFLVYGLPIKSTSQ